MEGQMVGKRVAMMVVKSVGPMVDWMVVRSAGKRVGQMAGTLAFQSVSQ